MNGVFVAFVKVINLLPFPPIEKVQVPKDEPIYAFISVFKIGTKLKILQKL